MLISVRAIRNSLHDTTVSGSHTWSCLWDQYILEILLKSDKTGKAVCMGYANKLKTFQEW